MNEEKEFQDEAELVTVLKGGSGSRKKTLCQVLCTAGGLLAGLIAGLLTDHLGWFLPIGLLVGVCAGGFVSGSKS